jgi:ABC-2 type transport system ATP-binding protein
VTAAAVEIVDLVVRFGATEAVSGLSMVAPAGKVTAVLGPNGAGKTTTVETCEGYRRPSSGRVVVLGRDPATDGADLRTRVGVMLQAGGVAGAVTARQILAYTAGLYAHPLEVGGLADRLGIDLRARTPFRRLSGGEQQRVRLALAVIGRPEVVFLDEPTAGLDPQARHATWDLLSELRADGVTVLLTTHFMEEAEELADHVVIVDHGRVVAAASPGELMANGSDRALRFRGPAGLDLSTLTATLPEGSRSTEDPAGSYRVDGDVGPALLAQVAAWCAGNDFMPEGLGVGRRTLEDVFLELTGRELR